MTHSKNHDKKLPKKNPGKYGKSLTFFTKKAFSDLWHTRKLWRKGDFWSFGDFRNCSITHPKWVGSCWTAFLLGSCLFCFTTAGLAKPGSWRVSSNSGGEWRFPPGWTTSCKRLVSGWLIPVYVRIMISLHSEPSWIMCYKRHSKMPTDWRFFSILLPFWLWESKPVFFFRESMKIWWVKMMISRGYPTTQVYISDQFSPSYWGAILEHTLQNLSWWKASAIIVRVAATVAAWYASGTTHLDGWHGGITMNSLKVGEWLTGEDVEIAWKVQLRVKVSACKLCCFSHESSHRCVRSVSVTS